MNNNKHQLSDGDPAVGCLLALIKFPFVLLRFFIGWSIVVLIRLPMILFASLIGIFSMNNKLVAWILEFDEKYLEKINKWMLGSLQ